MGRERIELGKEGEEKAANFLRKKGYGILERNYKNKIGEIDIIAKDKDTICFIEVKARTSLKFGLPEEAVTFSKQKKLNRIALGYLKHYNLLEAPARFDIVSVMFNSDNKAQISLIKDAF
ncbi:MAG: YraN family protein [Candidatus Omnitrophica bacterium]|nr:YraN family protein [Candidatus Omnitrophota bacterium]